MRFLLQTHSQPSDESDIGNEYNRVHRNEHCTKGRSLRLCEFEGEDVCTDLMLYEKEEGLEGQLEEEVGKMVEWSARDYEVKGSASGSGSV